MFDLTIFPLSLEAGREQYELSGLLVSAAPRKAARMRAQDHLVLYCRLVTTTAGGSKAAALMPAQQQEILSRLSETYFNFSGSVTAGLRAVAARLNDFLLNRNLKASNEGQTSGMLNLVAIHGESLIVAHAGITHSFVLSKGGVQHFDDSTVPGAARGLGLSRQPALRFYHATVESGDLLVLCPVPPVSWTARALDNSPQLTFEHIRRRLLSDAGVDLQTAVIRFQTGKGQVSFWRPGDATSAGSGKAPRPATGQGAALRKVQRDSSSAGLPNAALSEAERTQLAGGTSVPQRLEEKVEADFTSFVAPTAPAAETGAAEQAFEGQESTGAARIYDAVSSHPEPGVNGRNPLTGPAEAQDGRLEKAFQPEDEPPFPGGSPEDGEPAEDASASEGQEVDLPVRFGELPLVEDVLSGEYSARAGEPAAADERGPSEPPIKEDLAVRYPNLGVDPSNGKEGIYLGGRPEANEVSPTAPEPRPGLESTPASSVKEPSPVKASRPERPARKARPSGPSPVESFRRSLAGVWRRGSTARERTGGAISKASGALPRRHDAMGRELPFFNLSPGMMLMVALMVPLLVVTVAMTVYFRVGRSEQFQLVMLQAQQYAQQASAQTEPSEQLRNWEHVYELIHSAEKYGGNEESQALRKLALSHIDAMQEFVRLDYQPVGSNLFTAKTNITRIVATLNDVYLLDANTGSVLRLYRTASGYEIDPKFNCGPGPAGESTVGAVVDLAPLTPNNGMKSTVMGIDAGGNLIYCSPNTAGPETRLLGMPDSGWGKITGISLYNDTLYVLDPQANAVYRYDGIGAVFENPPHLYFGDKIPQMSDMIDMDSDQEFLYLLHDSGLMTVCDSSGFAFAATKCTDPAPYGDPRPGFEPAPLSFSGAHFIQLESTQPPDPSLFALDETNNSIYHLSLRRLNLQRQYRAQPDSDFPLPSSKPTAFTIAPNRRALIAFSSQVFFAALP